MSVGSPLATPDPGPAAQALAAAPLLAEFRAAVEAGVFTPEDREFVVQQAAAVIDGVYVHLWQKRAMYGLDPSQRLRLLRRQLGQLTDAQFHSQLQRIFDDLHDLHTQYVLPRPYQGRLASLGLLIEKCWADGKPRWLASHVRADLVGDPHLVAGAEITHWNGTPVAVAVARHAELEGGSNEAARLARGLDRMTQRPLALSQTPDEDWVDLRYRVDGAVHETRIPWRVVTADDTLTAIDDDEATNLPGVAAPASNLLALELSTEVIRRAKQALFAQASGPGPGPASAPAPGPGAAAPTGETDGAAPAGETDATGPTGETGTGPATAGDEADAGLIPNVRPPGELKARTVTTAHGTFGHLRIYTFLMADADIAGFLTEVQRLLTLLPREGLILDVRGNGGGYAGAAEGLLQMFTPRLVQPEPFQLINTAATADLCRKVPSFAAWSPSIVESLVTGAQYSSAIPLFPVASVNTIGQCYHGPVVLVTDGLCYSATDIFAAGFQDHEAGKVLGVDDNTGAGGANVMELSDFLLQWPGCPFEPLPGGARLRVAIRRSLRVGNRAGQPLEDLGVHADVRHRLTSRDLLHGNVDLMERAAELLAQQPSRRLDAALHPTAAGTELTLTTAGLSSVDIYLNRRPVGSTAVADGETTATIPLAPGTIRIEGFSGADLVAARTLTQ
jgi:C-terminal processing protease CtpA/Prc